MTLAKNFAKTGEEVLSIKLNTVARIRRFRTQSFIISTRKRSHVHQQYDETQQYDDDDPQNWNQNSLHADGLR